MKHDESQHFVAMLMWNTRLPADTLNESTFKLIEQKATDIGKVQTSLKCTQTDIEDHIAAIEKGNFSVRTQDVSN